MLFIALTSNWYNVHAFRSEIDADVSDVVFHSLMIFPFSFKRNSYWNPGPYLDPQGISFQETDNESGVVWWDDMTGAIPGTVKISDQ